MKETNWKIKIKWNNNKPTSSYIAHGYRNSALGLVECYADTRTKLGKSHSIFIIHGIPRWFADDHIIIVYNIIALLKKQFLRLNYNRWWIKYRSVNSTLVQHHWTGSYQLEDTYQLEDINPYVKCKRSVMYNILFLLNLYRSKISLSSYISNHFFLSLKHLGKCPAAIYVEKDLSQLK